MQITWLGHAACHVRLDGRSVLIDPWFSGNPKHPEGFEDGLDGVDLILLTHGHEDHGIDDVPRLASRFGATVFAQPEILAYLGGKGVSAVEPMNIGGTVERDGIAITMVHAEHSSSIVKDGLPVVMGDPAGFVIRSSERTVYHAGDTGPFSDMALIQRLYRPKIGFLPIGDRFTMGPEAAAFVCNEFLDLEVVIPIHYGTFPLLTGTPDAFRAGVHRGAVRIPEPGEALGF